MEITYKLNKDFERFFEKLNEEYGDDFTSLNGLDEKKLSPTDFLDSFVKSVNVADASVDSNANINQKDIVTLRSEQGKSQEKLLSYFKIFLEYKQKYGLRRAKKWFELEWNKSLYMHDANTATFVPYSYNKDETIIVYYNGNKLLTTFKELYDLIEEKEELLSSEDGAYAKYPEDLFVDDLVDNKIVRTKVSRVIKKRRDNEFRIIKTSNGFTEIVTDNHPIITDKGDVYAKDIIGGERLFTTSNYEWDGSVDKLYAVDILQKICNSDDEIVFGGLVVDDTFSSTDNKQVYIKKFTNQGKVFNNKNDSKKYKYSDSVHNVINLTSELGYIVGLTITDGNYYNSDIISPFSIKQKRGNVFDKLIDCLEKSNIEYKIYSDNSDSASQIKICNNVIGAVFRTMFLNNALSSDKSFNENILNYNADFVLGVVAGFIDGDGSVGRSVDSFTFFGDSRASINKLTHILRCFGYKPRMNLPVNETTNKFYRVLVHTYLNENLRQIPSVKVKNLKPIRTFEESCKFANSRYSYSDDKAFVYENKKFESIDDVVYDITTETGHFMCNDILSHNCFAYDLTKLVKEGLYYLPDHVKEEPAKHLETFVDFVKEFISYTSNRTSGACGLPNLIPFMYWFWKNDCENGIHGLKVEDPERFAKSEIQRLIFAMNQPYTRDGTQSAFINTSVFDSEYFDALFGGMEFPDGTFAIDEKAGIMQFQKWFLEEMSKIKDDGHIFTFPVNTASMIFKDGKFVDEDFARWVCEHNRKWNDSNIFCDSSVNSLSNCCRLKSNIKNIGYFEKSENDTLIEEKILEEMYKDYCNQMEQQ